MKHIYRFFLTVFLFNVAACAPLHHYGHKNGQAETVELPKNASASRYDLAYGTTHLGDVDMATIMSNENVIVYPVDGDTNSNRREFPEYRSIIENTTAGGYTVFDQSVTVYPVEGGAVPRPSYLPEYSVPKYVQPKLNSVPLRGRDSLMPVPLTQSYGDGIVAEPLMGAPTNMPRAPRLTQSGAVSHPDKVDTKQVSVTANADNKGRRSGPMLTGY